MSNTIPTYEQVIELLSAPGFEAMVGFAVVLEHSTVEVSRLDFPRETVYLVHHFGGKHHHFHDTPEEAARAFFEVLGGLPLHT